MYRADYEELENATNHGYSNPMRIGFIFREPVVSASEFCRLYNPEHTDRIYTLNDTEADELIRCYGYSDRGYVGYVFECPVCGSVPLYRLYNAEEYDHYYTTNESDVENRLKQGYTSQGTAGVILPQL